MRLYSEARARRGSRPALWPRHSIQTSTRMAERASQLGAPFRPELTYGSNRARVGCSQPQNGAVLRRIPVLCVIAITMALSSTAGAQSPSTTAQPSLTCSGAVSWQRAGSLVGRVATIQGHVAGTRYAASSNGSPTFLNLGVNYPNPSRFTVVIWIENRAAFGRPEVRYRGRTMCVRGRVQSYQGVPEIIARSTRQIKVIR
jgi:hypothetical protein